MSLTARAFDSLARDGRFGGSLAGGRCAPRQRLGLRSVYRILQLHGSRIELLETAGADANFRFRLQAPSA